MTQEEELRQLREENATLRAENQELRQRVTEMDTRLKQIEERVAKDSHNSHLPPSSNRFHRPKKTRSLRTPSQKKPGAQTGHEGQTLYQVSEPDQIIVHAVETCANCQSDLSSVPAQGMERRQVLDIPPKRVVVIEHQGQQKVCPDCHAVTKACFPEGVSAPIQYSPAFGAVGVYLTQQQLLPYERACETLQDVLGPAMTVGTLKNLVERCAATLKPIEPTRCATSDEAVAKRRKMCLFEREERNLFSQGGTYGQYRRWSSNHPEHFGVCFHNPLLVWRNGTDDSLSS